jgi:TolB protein
MNKIFIQTLFLLSLICTPLHHAMAEIVIDVTKGNFKPLPIAVSTFHYKIGQQEDIARQIPRIISKNLENSGLFDPVNPRAFVQDPRSIVQDGPRFGEWRAINAQALVTGKVMRGADGKTRVEFRLWDVFSQQQLIGMAYMTTPQNWRRIAHIISDEIYKRLTGESGYFDTRIVYISEEGSPGARIKRLAIMDQDGANHRYLTDGDALVLTPRFSPNAQEITYLAYHNKKPRVYLYNIDTGRQEILGDFPGMTFAPRFSPDGNKVIFSMSKNGNSDIYVMDLRTRRVKQLTNNSAIDTSPSFAPDGRQVIFESDRGGSQQLYVMNSDGSNVHRITFDQGRYANPVWSPRGDMVAFTKILRGNFYIGVIRPDGTGERLITKAYHVEGPSWSPNGRVLVYFKERPVGPKGNRRSAKLYTIDLTGYNERMLQTPKDASDPAWSPLNP